MPLAILAVAAVLLWQGSAIRSDQHDAVRGFVAAVCGDILQGRDPSLRLAATDPLVRGALVQRLEDALDPDSELSIEVSAGDTPEAGAFTGSATHVALLKLDGTPVVGLRVAYGADGGDVVIIGFWQP